MRLKETEREREREREMRNTLVVVCTLQLYIQHAHTDTLRCIYTDYKASCNPTTQTMFNSA